MHSTNIHASISRTQRVSHDQPQHLDEVCKITKNRLAFSLLSQNSGKGTSLKITHSAHHATHCNVHSFWLKGEQYTLFVFKEQKQYLEQSLLQCCSSTHDPIILTSVSLGSKRYVTSLSSWTRDLLTSSFCVFPEPFKINFELVRRENSVK